MRNEIKEFYGNHKKKISIALITYSLVLFGIVIFAYNVWPDFDGYMFDGISNPQHLTLELLTLLLIGTPYILGILIFPIKKKKED